MTVPRGSGSQRLEVVVNGHVQGVGFRWFVQREAARLELDGWVANRPDGSVEVVAEGSAEDLARLLGRLQEGPAGASVSETSERYEPARGNLGGFSIRSGAHRGD